MSLREDCSHCSKTFSGLFVHGSESRKFVGDIGFNLLGTTSKALSNTNIIYNIISYLADAMFGACFRCFVFVVFGLLFCFYF